jgi:hypothetical protein
MFRFRKISFFIALLGLTAFASLSVAETFHHHGDLESHDDCAFCSFAQTGSHSSMPTTAPVLVPTLLQIFITFTAFTFVPSVISFFSSGRSPPVSSPHF